MRMLGRYLLLLSMCVYCIQFCLASNYSTWTNYIEGIFNKLDMTGLGVAVVMNDSIIYQHSFGYREIPSETNSGMKLKDDDIFRIASISKTFLATVILQLEEEGRLKLADRADKYLHFPLVNPHYPEVPISIFHLLTHTSSLNDSQSRWDLEKIDLSSKSYNPECYSIERPGEYYQYCNLNYNLIGAIIENITGNNISDEVKIRILLPLNIRGSFDTEELDKNKLVKLYRYKSTINGYKEETSAYKPFKNLSTYRLGRDTGGYFNPAGGLKMSVGDLATYMMMHMHNGEIDGIRLISEKDENRMRNNYVGLHNYGLSYRQYKDIIDNYIFYGQTGGAFGLRSAMIFEPQNKIGFIIISSGSKSKYIDGYIDIHRPIIKRICSDLL